MKKSIKKDTHTGNQPIRVLKHNLTTRLVERNEEYIKSLHSDFKLEKGIKYHIANLPLIERQMPFIDEDGIINLHETFLSYVWINCYYFFILHEEGFAIPDHIRRGAPVHKSQNIQLLKEAEELFNYGKSLIVGFVEWDKVNFPNPEYFDEETEEGWYILRTNDLFVEVLNFILYHETAHAELEHIKKIKSENLSDSEVKLLEIEADTRAVELIISNIRNRNMTELAIAIGLASMLFFKNTLGGGKRHPNLDQRIENAVTLLQPAEDSSIWPMLSLFLKAWDRQFQVGLKQKPIYDTYKDLFYDFLEQIK
jgi:Peptidase U49